MEIEITNQQNKIRFPLKKINQIAKKILREFSLENKALSIVLTDDCRIRELNSRYLGKDRITDVLAFSMLEGKKIGDKNLLGDVVISVETCARQALYFKKSLEEELYLYLVHGILHLLGYEDRYVSERRVMKKLQAKILKRILP